MVQKVGGSLADSSLSHVTASKVFNITDEKETLSLLKEIHRSSLEQDKKNELRDALFSYRQPDSLLTNEAVESLFAEIGFHITSGADSFTESTVETNSSTQVPKLGRSRLAPIFTPNTKREIKLQVKGDVIEKTSTPEFSAKKNEEVEVVEPKAEEVKETPLTENVDKEVSAQKVVVENKKAVEEVVNPMDRIKEIKRTVNELVGNPVSLIDAHNQIGREYMNALLSAMKTVNGGTTEDVSNAMTRLEEVFEKVKNIDLTKSAETQVAPDEVKKVVEEKSSREPLPVAALDAEVKTETGASVETTVVDKEIPTDVAPTIHNEIPTQVSDKNIPAETLSSPVTENAVHEAEEAEPSKSIANREPVIMSVGKEKQLQNLMQVNRAKEMEESKQAEEKSIASMDPLMTPEVTAGLNQLLSEWSLFKSSGFFGTGSGGVDHPLYKKIAHLTMAAVIAGRFEGATAQVKQSITDYMNGWRYEEGIVHEHAETFERYLRRVIAHILTKAPKKEK